MRPGACVLAILLFLSPAIAAGKKADIDSQLLSIFYDEWRASAFGQAPDNTERAEWIFYDDSRYVGQQWPASYRRKEETWHGLIPQDAVGQAHTHPSGTDPRPSGNDVAVARRLGMPVYTVSRSGIWMASPEGEIRQLADSHWYQSLHKR